MGSNFNKFLLAIFCGVASFQIGCSSSSGSNSDLSPIPLDEGKFFEKGLQGSPVLVDGQYQGEMTLEFTYSGKTTTNPAGTLEVGISRTGDQLQITYVVRDPNSPAPVLSNRYVSTIVGNSLVRSGNEIGQIGSYSILFEDQKWTYKFLRGLDEDLKTPVIKVTATTIQGDQTAIYRAVLKRK